MSNEVKYMTLSEVVDAYLKKSRKVKKKQKAIRILRIYYYGKMKLAKAIRKRIWIEIKTREFAYWNRVAREMRRSRPTYQPSEEIKKRIEAYKNGKGDIDQYKKLLQ